MAYMARVYGKSVLLYCCSVGDLEAWGIMPGKLGGGQPQMLQHKGTQVTVSKFSYLEYHQHVLYFMIIVITTYIVLCCAEQQASILNQPRCSKRCFFRRATGVSLNDKLRN